MRVHDPRPVPMAFTDPAIEMHALVVHPWDGEPVNVAPDEHDRLGWFTASEVGDLHLADPASLPDIVRMAWSTPGAGSAV